jgi:hypothetical protein
MTPSLDEDYTLISKATPGSVNGRWYIAGCEDHTISSTCTGTNEGLFAGWQGPGAGNVKTTPVLGLNNGAWHHVVGVWDRGANLTLWVDGVNRSSVSIAADQSYNANTNAGLFLGRMADVTNPANPYNSSDLALAGSSSRIDDVRVFNRVLTSTEITALFNTSNLSGSALIKRIGSDGTTSTAPAGITAQVDTLPSQGTNPSSFSLLDSSTAHVVLVSDTVGYAKTAGTCTYPIAGTECTVASFNLTPSCDGTSCSLSFNISSGQVTKIAFKYLVYTPPPPVIEECMMADDANYSATDLGLDCSGVGCVAHVTVPSNNTIKVAFQYKQLPPSAPRCAPGLSMRTGGVTTLYGTPESSGSVLGTQDESSNGIIATDPITGRTSPTLNEVHWWCYTDFSAGLDGWVIDTNLKRNYKPSFESL